VADNGLFFLSGLMKNVYSSFYKKYFIKNGKSKGRIIAKQLFVYNEGHLKGKNQCGFIGNCALLLYCINIFFEKKKTFIYACR